MVNLANLLAELNNPVLYESGGNREFISSNIFELTGYYAEEMRMNRDLFPGLINPEDYIETNFKIKNWHKNNEPGILTLHFRFLSSNGLQLWVEDHLIGLEENGQKYMQGIMLNISPYKEKETELLQLRTIWREKELKDEKEREAVFTDIQRQIDDLGQVEKKRKEKVAIILNHAGENKLRFKSLPL